MGKDGLIYYIARGTRLAVVQQQYDLGHLTEEEAREILAGPLRPGDDTTVVDDSGELVMGDRAICSDCGAIIPADGNCWYCENKPDGGGGDGDAEEGGGVH